jgi:hypothetical protein
MQTRTQTTVGEVETFSVTLEEAPVTLVLTVKEDYLSDTPITTAYTLGDFQEAGGTYTVTHSYTASGIAVAETEIAGTNSTVIEDTTIHVVNRRT